MANLFAAAPHVEPLSPGSLRTVESATARAAACCHLMLLSGAKIRYDDHSEGQLSSFLRGLSRSQHNLWVQVRTLRCGQAHSSDEGHSLGRRFARGLSEARYVAAAGPCWRLPRRYLRPLLAASTQQGGTAIPLEQRPLQHSLRQCRRWPIACTPLVSRRFTSRS